MAIVSKIFLLLGARTKKSKTGIMGTWSRGARFQRFGDSTVFELEDGESIHRPRAPLRLVFSSRQQQSYRSGKRPANSIARMKTNAVRQLNV